MLFYSSDREENTHYVSCWQLHVIHVILATMREQTKLKHIRKKMTVVGKETTENNQNVNHLLTINWKLIFFREGTIIENMWIGYNIKNDLTFNKETMCNLKWCLHWLLSTDWLGFSMIILTNYFTIVGAR